MCHLSMIVEQPNAEQPLHRVKKLSLRTMKISVNAEGQQNDSSSLKPKNILYEIYISLYEIKQNKPKIKR